MKRPICERDLGSIEELNKPSSLLMLVHAGAPGDLGRPSIRRIVGTQNVLDLCREYAVKRLVCFFSSIYAAGKIN